MLQFIPILIVTLFLAVPTIAAPFDVPIDPSQSRLYFELCIAGGCDTDSTPITGTVTIELDSVDDPAQIWLYDFREEATEDLHWYIDLGLLGDFDATLTDAAMLYANPGVPMGPEPIVHDDFVFHDVPVNLEGLFSYTATGLLCALLEGAGHPCSDTRDLAEGGTQNIEAWGGTITSQDRFVSLTSDVDVTMPFDPNDPDLGGLHIYGTIYGQTYVPIPGDVDGDGDVDLEDLAALLASYDKCEGDPGYNPDADFDGDGCVTLADLAALLANYGT